MATGKKFGGRVKGTPNKEPDKIKRLARRHGPAAIEQLAELMKTAGEKAVRVSAARELLDRGFGKATTIVAGDKSQPIRVIISGDDKNL